MRVVGKIERTSLMLDLLENPELRQRCHAGLNNSEQRHVLTQGTPPIWPKPSNTSDRLTKWCRSTCWRIPRRSGGSISPRSLDFLWERAAAASGRKALILPAQTRAA